MNDLARALYPEHNDAEPVNFVRNMAPPITHRLRAHSTGLEGHQFQGDHLLSPNTPSAFSQYPGSVAAAGR